MRLILLVIALFMTLPLAAHRLNIFPIVHKDTVIIRVYFRLHQPAIGAHLTVTDAHGTMLAKGLSDSDGRFTFAHPGAIDCTIHAKDAAGHSATLVLTAQRLAEALGESTETASDPPSTITLTAAAVSADHEERLRAIEERLSTLENEASSGEWWRVVAALAVLMALAIGGAWWAKWRSTTSGGEFYDGR